VLDGDPVPPLQIRAEPLPPISGPCLLLPNGWMYQDGTWHEGRPQPRRLCVRWGPSPPPHKGGGTPPQFSAHFYCGQTAGCMKMPLCMEVALSPGDWVRWGPSPLPKGSWRPGAESPQFSAHAILAERLDGSRCHLAWR